MPLILNKKSVALFFLLNTPFWILYIFWGQGLRLATILLAFVSMWSLWVARRERKHLWTPKMHDLWLVQLLWCVATVEGNSELYYRHAHPSIALLLVVGILWLTVKGVFSGDKYTINQP